MSTFEIIQLLVGSGGLLGIIILAFRMGRVAQKIDSLDQKVTDMKNHTEKNMATIQHEVRENGHAINYVKIKMGKLETRMDGKTMVGR